MRTRGFTLVELLIVMAVIAILAAILLPSGYPRWEARNNACQSQMKQLAAAAAMYATDHDKQYPPAGITCLNPAQPDGSPGCPGGALERTTRNSRDQQVSRYGYGETWQGGGLRVLEPYLKSEPTIWCPEQAKVGSTPTDPKSYYNGFEWLKSPERVRYPTAKVLLMEAYSFHDRKAKELRRLDDPPNPNRRYNIAFVDGHVKSVDLSTGCSGNSDPSCSGWESCLGKGGNGAYFCSGFGNGVDVPDFPVKNSGLMLRCLMPPPK